MNLTYRFHQLLNLLRSPQKTGPIRWLYIYGVPRSGSTFLMQQYMKHAQRGIGDWETDLLVPAITLWDETDYILIDTDEVIDSMAKHLLKQAPPGGGNKYDLVIKQVKTTLQGFHLLERMFGPPVTRIFLYRHPEHWMPSARKKFGLDDAELVDMYVRSLDSFHEIGGTPINYDDIPNHPLLRQSLGALSEFNLSKASPEPVSNDAPIMRVYTAFISKLDVS